MKNIFLTVLLAGFCSVVQAQHTLLGRVTDKNNLPLEHVDVYIGILQKGTSTNALGEFKLTNLPAAPIDLTISLIGYQRITKTIELKEATTSMDFILEETVFKMGEILISTPFSRLQTENVMKVERATIQNLEKSGGITLMQQLSTLHGISQVATGMGIGKPVIRGLRGNRVLVYNQGLRMENQQFGDEHGLGVDENSIESVELIKGPASMLYGSDAMGGVLYFNPIRFAETNTSVFEFGSSYSTNTLGNKTFFNIKKSLENWKFLVNANTTQHSDYKTGDKNRTFNSRFREKAINLATAYSNQDMSATLRVQQTDSDIGIPENIPVNERFKTPEVPFQNIKNQLISLQNIFFLSNSKITTTFGYTLNKRKEFEEEHEEETEHHEEHTGHNELHAALDLKLHTFSSDIKWAFNKKRGFENVVGMQYMNQKNRNFGEEILIPNAEKEDIGFYATTILDKKNNSFQGGIRYDRRGISTASHEVHEEEGHEEEGHEEGEHGDFDAIDRNYESLSLSLGMKSKLWNTIISRINLASGFKAPTLAELTSNGVHHGTNRYEIGNAGLKKEKNIQADVALEYQSDHLELFANGFYNYINDYIYIAPENASIDGTQVFNYVQNDAKLYGGEFGFHLHPHPYDWLHFQSSFEMVIGKLKEGDYLPLIPAHKLTNTVRSEFNNGKGYLQLTLENHFKQDKVSAYESVSEAYELLNLSAGADFKVFNDIDMTIHLNFNNIFDKKYTNHLSRLKPDGIFDMGRNLIIALKLKI